MIKAYYGLKDTPFDKDDITMTEQQYRIYNDINAHSKIGGLCIIAGQPGTGKSTIMDAIKNLGKNKSVEVPTMSRTMHSYTNIIKILMEAYKLENKHSMKECEAAILQAAFATNSEGKTLITVIDDAHLLKMEVLRKLRLLFDVFPRNHCLVLMGQMELLQKLADAENADIKSRVTYSMKIIKINSIEMQKVIMNELDKCALAHSTFSEGALELIIRHADGNLRLGKNLILGSLVQAIMEKKKTVDINIVNSVLLQPHWMEPDELRKQA